MLDIRIIDIMVMPKEAHRGTGKTSRSFPVIVQRAIAIIIEAKNSISISFKDHKINMEIIKNAIDIRVVGFNLNN